jgi:glycosyltransferase involved in cell wall biosynthesis
VSDPLRVTLVGRSDREGGAARALRRAFDTLRDHAPELGLDVRLRVAAPVPPEPGVVSGYPGGAARVRRRVSRIGVKIERKLPFRTGNVIMHSTAGQWTGLGRELDRSGAQVLNLHWLGTGTLSIEEIGRLRTPVVWTLHDMWAFCGAEHYTDDDRFVRGYPPGTRPPGEGGIDRNRRTWLRKQRSWTRPHHVVTPSRWLAGLVSKSLLMRDWPVVTIPNPLDLQVWSPADAGAARAALGLPHDADLILFGADGGVHSPIKGMDLLLEALHHLAAHTRAAAHARPTELVVFGGDERTVGVHPSGLRVHHLGAIRDDGLLRHCYAAADVMVVPSRLDNLPQTAVEAQACGTPVVAFRVGGLPEIVEDAETGRLAEPFDPAALGEAIAWVLQDEARRRRLGTNARARTIERFDTARIANAYARVYREAFDLQRGRGAMGPPRQLA